MEIQPVFIYILISSLFTNSNSLSVDLFGCYKYSHVVYENNSFISFIPFSLHFFFSLHFLFQFLNFLLPS
jgi:hypothetical protein